MKCNQGVVLFAFLVIAALVTSGEAAAIIAADSHAKLRSHNAALNRDDRPITQVVKLLQSLLTESKSDGDSERILYAKFKCYCDQNKAAKEAEIERLTKEIALVEDEIEKLLSDTALLSKEVAQLKVDMAANIVSQTTANTTRGTELAAYNALKLDLQGAEDQLRRAIRKLSDIGADQSLDGFSAADHQKFMAGYNAADLLSLKATVKQALLAASTSVGKKKVQHLEAFLQAPFTGSYTSQSAEVLGILKDMRATFAADLTQATAKETAAVTAHAAYILAMVRAYETMGAEYDEKQGTLSSNDLTLSGKKSQLWIAVQAKSDAEDFLSKLLPMCATKATEYDSRTMLRANEEAAIAEAISILNSDAAFEAFGKVSATSGVPTLIQLSAKHRKRGPMGQDARRQHVQALLRGVPGSRMSMHVSHVLALLAAYNPFTIVLEEIQKMIDLIAEEETADDEQLAWCQEERRTNRNDLRAAKAQINTLNTAISALVTEIDDPVTGLKVVIKEKETLLLANSKAQADQTEDRKEENIAYQKDIAHLVEAQELVAKAIEVLKLHYAQMLGGAFVAVSSSDDPAPPSTWSGPYTGKSDQVTGQASTSAITMLEFILTSTETEEKEAHDSELESQHLYEDSMEELKIQEGELQTALAALRATLAEKEKELGEKREELKDTIAVKMSIEAYLLKIKPGCDFITNNIGARKSNRITETQALTDASIFLKDTPHYIESVEAAHNESLGDCLTICAGNEDHVDCKACLAHVSVPGYCAGHPGTAGC